MSLAATARLTLASLGLCLSGMASVAAPPAGPLAYGVVPGEDTLILRVISTGCTKREHFKVSLDGDRRLVATRLKPDLCRARPRPLELRFRFSELGLSGPVFFAAQRE